MIISALFLTSTVFLVLRQIAIDEAESRFQQVTLQYHQALKERLDRHIILSYTLGSHIAHLPVVTPEAMAAVLDPLRPFFPSLISVGWVTLQPSQPSQGRRYATTFLEPDSAENPATSLDGPDMAAAMERACTGGRLVATTRTPLSGAADSPPHLVLLMPLYHPAGTKMSDTAPACPALMGIVATTFDVRHLVGSAVDTLQPTPADLYVLDGAKAGPPHRLATHPAADRRTPFVPAPDAALLSALPASLPLAVDGALWRMVILPATDPPWTAGMLAAWGILVMGLATTALVGVHLHREDRAKIMLQTEARARAAMARMLRESEERFRLALRHSKVTVFSQDRHLRYVWIYNPQIGLSPDRFLGRHDSDLFTPPSAAEQEALKRQVLDTGIGIRREVTVTPAAADTGPADSHVLDLVIEPLRENSGAVCGVICAAVDITESALTKNALAEAHAEAQRANHAKTRFLAAASHDLRQPFQAMSLFHHLLMTRLDPPALRDIAIRLGNAITAGSELLNALLDTSALEAGTLKPRLEVFAFQTVAERLAGEIDGQAQEKGLALRTVATSVPVRSDPVLLERMLRNLLVNALRYTRDGRILLGCRRRSGRLLVQVWDTGPGIAPEQLERIFDDFYRGDADAGDGSRGLGLGLATVRRMAHLLDHPVSVCSWPGRGTVFSVSVPIADPGLRTCDTALHKTHDAPSPF